MTPLASVRGIAQVGLDGDAHADRASPRQVLLFDRRVLDEQDLDAAAVRANVVLDGAVDALASGAELCIGTLRLRATIPCTPCPLLDRERPGLARVLAGRRGMLARVVGSGVATIGDPVTITRDVFPALDPAWPRRVAAIVARIPDGVVLTYARLAHLAGVETAYCRAFPRVLARCPNGERVVPERRLSAAARTWSGDGYHSAMDLERFVAAQDASPSFLDELRGGRKTSHWMWFVFPQIAGLGHSAMAQRYAIASLEEARAYLAHPVLGARLRECVEVLLSLGTRDPVAIFGSIDAMKLRSSLTLFLRAAPDDPLFQRALDRFYGGVADAATDARLR